MTRTHTASSSATRQERVPQPVIDELLSKSSLLDLIRESSRIHCHDGQHRMACPFHARQGDELSLSVDTTGQRFDCSICHFHGSAIGWLMYHDGLAFPEALQELARRTGVSVTTWIPDDAGDDVGKRTLALLAEVDAFHAGQLIGSQAAAYLERRGISESTARRYELGYAPATTDAIEEVFRDRRRELWHRGLLIRQSDGTFRARFNNRLMFPIRNENGETVGHGARTLGGARLKYLNSPTSPIFEKRRLVYGLYEAVRSASSDALLLVEGYVDVLALAEHGFPRGIATLGTAVSDNHIRTIFSHSDQVVACFDADEAGQKAAARLAVAALPILKDEQVLSFAHLPEGEDPDSLLRTRGRQAMIDALTRTVPIEDVLHDHIGHGLDLKSIGGKAALAARAKPVVQTTRSKALKTRVVERLELTIGIPWLNV